MVDNCKQHIDDIDESIMSNSEKQEFFNQLKNAAQSKLGRSALRDTSKGLMDEHEEMLTTSKRDQYLSKIRAADAVSQVLSHRDHNKGLESVLVGAWSNVKDAGRSADYAQKSARQIYGARFDKTVTHTDLAPYFNDKNNSAELAKALHNIDDTNDKRIKEIVRNIHKIQKSQFDHANSLGASLNKLEDFGVNHSHDAAKMLLSHENWSERQKVWNQLRKKYGNDMIKVRSDINEMAFERWKSTILPRLDVERSFKNGDTESILRKVFDNITNPGKIVKGRSLGSRLRNQRKLHFKDGQSWLEYNEEYGSGSVQSAVADTFNRNSDTIGRLSKMGPDPEMWWNEVQDGLSRRSEQKDINYKKQQKNFDIVMGKDKVPNSYTFAKTAQAIRSLKMMSSLGLSVIKSVTDLAQGVSMLKSNGMNIFESWGNTLKTFPMLFKKNKRNDFLDAVGTFSDTAMGHAHSRYDSLDGPAGFLSKGVGLFFRANLQHVWDGAMRSAVGSSLARNLAKFTDREFKGLPSELQRNLSRYGIEEREWDLIRANKKHMKNVDGKLYVAPDSVPEYSQRSVAIYARKRQSNLTQELHENTLREVQLRLQSYFSEMSDVAQVQPSAAIKRMVYQGTNPGTFTGELMRFVAQFQMYGIGIARNTIGRLFKENSDSSFTENLLNRNIPMKNIAHYMLAATVFGYLSHSLKSLITQGTLPNPFNLDTGLSSMKDATGIWSDTLKGISDKYQQGWWSSLEPPIFKTLDQAGNLLATLGSYNETNHRLSYGSRVSKSALNFLKNNTPGQNLLYTSSVLNYLYYKGILNAIDPQYTKMMQTRISKQQQQNGDYRVF